MKDQNIIYGLCLIGVIFVVITLVKKSNKKKYKSPFMMRKERFYDNYRLSQAQAERDVNCEYKGFITNPV
jgi:hypothetical protein